MKCAEYKYVKLTFETSHVPVIEDPILCLIDLIVRWASKYGWAAVAFGDCAKSVDLN